MRRTRTSRASRCERASSASAISPWARCDRRSWAQEESNLCAGFPRRSCLAFVCSCPLGAPRRTGSRKRLFSSGDRSFCRRASGSRAHTSLTSDAAFAAVVVAQSRAVGGFEPPPMRKRNGDRVCTLDDVGCGRVSRWRVEKPGFLSLGGPWPPGKLPGGQGRSIWGL